MTAPKSYSPAQKKGDQKKSKQAALTLCPAPDLDWSRAQSPASGEFGDIYFSVEGGLDETRAVYLRACGLPERWAEPRFESKAFVIGELGFGTGLNFLALWQMWKQHRKPAFENSGPRNSEHRLHYISVEKFPFSKDDLARALESCVLEMWPELSEFAQELLAVWPGRVRGMHTLHLGDGLTLTLCHDDVVDALGGLSMQADAWFLDGFSPAKNPAMWTEQVMTRVGELCAEGARVGTFSAAGAVRAGLSAAGFDVQKVEGFGRKRHRIEAVRSKLQHVREVQTKPIRPVIARPVIIGAGIAGACLAHAFARRGIDAVVIDKEDGSGASENAAAMIKPRLDRQDNAPARFALSCYLYALQMYEKTGAVTSRGVTHLPQGTDQKTRFRALTDTPALPLDHMQWDADKNAVQFPQAQVIKPSIARSFLLGDCTRIKGGVENIERRGETYAALDAGGEVLAVGSHIIYALGAGARGRPEFKSLDLRYNRGQISWAELGASAQAKLSESALTYNGYALAVDGGILLGATHSRLEEAGIAEDALYTPRAVDDTHNFAAYQMATGETAVASERASRVSIRVNTKTTWPFVADISPQVWALSGLGSRGFVFAPLMAEMFVAELMGEVFAWPKFFRKQKL